MDEQEMLNICMEIAKKIGRIIDEKRQQLHLDDNNANDFYFCLGGAVARLTKRLGNSSPSSGSSESFLEGFSSYLRYDKEVHASNDKSVYWLFDKSTANN